MTTKAKGKTKNLGHGVPWRVPLERQGTEQQRRQKGRAQHAAPLRGRKTKAATNAETKRGSNARKLLKTHERNFSNRKFLQGYGNRDSASRHNAKSVLHSTRLRKEVKKRAGAACCAPTRKDRNQRVLITERGLEIDDPVRSGFGTPMESTGLLQSEIVVLRATNGSRRISLRVKQMPPSTLQRPVSNNGNGIRNRHKSLKEKEKRTSNIR